MTAPFGSLIVRAQGGALAEIGLVPYTLPPVEPQSSLLMESVRQLRAYFLDPGYSFALPLALPGTPYRRRVWDALRRMAPGEVRTYGELACLLQTGARAVAGACRSNPFPILIPCHRIVATHGLGGYCGRREGPYLDIKRWLLHHEGYGSTGVRAQ